MDVSGKDGPIGAVLDLDAVGGHVNRRIAVVALERGDGLFLAHLRDRSAGEADCKDDAKGAHSLHLTAPCTIFKRAPPSSTTFCAPPRPASAPGRFELSSCRG